MSTLPATTLTLDAPADAVAHSSIAVSVTGLQPGEKFTIAISRKVLLSGTAPATGPASGTVALGYTPAGSATLVATGAAANRTGSRPIMISPDGGVTTRTKSI
jgi:hypothetical protein